MKHQISTLLFLYATLFASANAAINNQKLLDACKDLQAGNRITQSPESCVDDVNSGKLPTQTIVGVYFLSRRDYESAEQLFRKGADIGDPVAQNGLGYLYQFGYGVEEKEQRPMLIFLN